MIPLHYVRDKLDSAKTTNAATGQARPSNMPETAECGQPLSAQQPLGVGMVD